MPISAGPLDQGIYFELACTACNADQLQNKWPAQVDHVYGNIARICACGNRKFCNEVHHQDLGSIRPQAECFSGSDDAPSWEMCNCHTGMGSCFYPMTCRNIKAAMQKLYICTHPFSAWLASWSSDNIEDIVRMRPFSTHHESFSQFWWVSDCSIRMVVLILSMMQATLVTKTFKITSFNVDVLWCSTITSRKQCV